MGLRLQIRHARSTVNHMVHYQARLDATFAALSDVTRRGVLEQLGRTDASVSDLAQRFRMTLTGMKKHVRVLESAGLVTTEKNGRVRTCRIGPEALRRVEAWAADHTATWEARLDRLGDALAAGDPMETADGGTPAPRGTRPAPTPPAPTPPAPTQPAPTTRRRP